MTELGGALDRSSRGYRRGSLSPPRSGATMFHRPDVEFWIRLDPRRVYTVRWGPSAGSDGSWIVETGGGQRRAIKGAEDAWIVAASWSSLMTRAGGESFFS